MRSGALPEVIQRHVERVDMESSNYYSSSQPNPRIMQLEEQIMQEKLRFCRQRNAYMEKVLEIAQLDEEIKRNTLRVQQRGHKFPVSPLSRTKRGLNAGSARLSREAPSTSLPATLAFDPLQSTLGLDLSDAPHGFGLFDDDLF